MVFSSIYGISASKICLSLLNLHHCSGTLAKRNSKLSEDKGSTNKD